MAETFHPVRPSERYFTIVSFYPAPEAPFAIAMRIRIRYNANIRFLDFAVSAKSSIVLPRDRATGFSAYWGRFVGDGHDLGQSGVGSRRADGGRKTGGSRGRSNCVGLGIMQKNGQVAEQNRDAAHPDHSQVDVVRQSPLQQAEQVSLARRLRHGERVAAEELVDAYYARIFLLMRAMGYDRQTSEDLTQETFMKAWAHIGQLRDGKALTGWLFRIAGNVARLQWRRQKRLEPAVLDTAEASPDGATQAGTRERSARLREAVSHLPIKLRQAIVLHYMNELTIAEAAEAVGISQGTLKSRLNRALEALRKQSADW